MEGLFALLGVVLGVGLTHFLETRQTARSEALSARLELPGILTCIWAPQPMTPMWEQIGKTRARANLLGLDPNLVEAVAELAEECWHES